MTPQVLILSNLYDISTDLVTVSLEAAGVPYLRLNREEFAEQRLSLDPLVPEFHVSGPGGDYSIGPNLKSVFFRQPVFLRNTPSVALRPKINLNAPSGWRFFEVSASLPTPRG